jgi:2-dehydropantoate 2-reductase
MNAMETRTTNEDHQVMRIAVMGAGGVGGYYGARLADAGHDVTFIARGDHLRALKEKGLALRGPAGDIVVSPVRATDDPAEIAPVDVVLFCVKLFDTEDAARACRPLLEHGGLCVSLQNGVDGQHRINAVLGKPLAIGGLAFVSAVIESPGVIRYVSTSPSIQFGEADGRASERTTRFRDACVAAGFGAEVVPDIRAAQWRKFVGLTTNAALTSLARQPAGVVYHDPDLLALARAASSFPPISSSRTSRSTGNFPPGCTRRCTTISRAGAGSSSRASRDSSCAKAASTRSPRRSMPSRMRA